MGSEMVKRIGLGLLLVGFAWLVVDVASSFTSYQYTRWVFASQNLPAGDSISRDSAVSAMRELSLDLKNRHRVVLIPACLMVAGGFLTYFGQNTGRVTKSAQHQAGGEQPAPRSESE